MSDQFIKVRIGGEYTGGPAFNKAGEDIKNVGTQATKASAAMSELGRGIQQGIGQALTGAALNKLSQIPQVLEAAARMGIEFNATLESSRLGIAAIIKQFDTTGRFANFETALAAAGDAIDLLKAKAAQSPATFQELVQGFQGLSGAFASAGLNMRQQVDLVVLMSQSLSGLGIRSDQLLQESRALVTGNITEDAQAAKILGIDKGQIDAARESGKLFEFLSGKLGAFAEAGAAGAKTFNVQISSLNDALQQLAATGTEEVFAQIRQGLVELNKALGTDQAKQTAAGIGSVIASSVEGIGTVASAAGKAWSFIEKIQDGASSKMQSMFAGVGSLFGADPQTQEILRSLARGGPIAALFTQARKSFDSGATAPPAPAQAAEPDAPRAQNWYGDPKAFAKGFKATQDNAERNRALEQSVADAEAADMGPRERAARLRAQLAEARGSFRDDLSQGKGVELSGDFTAGTAQQAIGGLRDTEAADHFGERLKGIIELSRESKDADKAAGEVTAKHAELLTGLQEELSIQQALRAGHETEAQLLTLQRDLRQELAEIAEADLAPAERERANELARQTAEMQKQKLLADQQRQIAAAEAGLAVSRAEQGTSRRALRDAKLEQFRVQKREDFKDLPPAEADRLVNEASGIEARRLRKADGIIGGPATRSSRDTLGGGIDNLAGRRTGTAMDDDFARTFRRTPLVDVMPASPASIGVTGGDKAAEVSSGGLDSAAGKVQQAAAQTQTAAAALNGAAGALDEISPALQSLVGAMGEMRSTLAEVKAEVARLNSEHS